MIAIRIKDNSSGAFPRKGKPGELVATFVLSLTFVSIQACNTLALKPIEDISKECTQEVTVNYRVEARGYNQSTVAVIIEILEKIPDPLQRVVNDDGVVVVVFQGDAWDHVPPYEASRSLGDLSGAFVPSTREILIDVDAHRPTSNSVSLELHEFGHAIDRIVADMMDTPYGSGGEYWVSDSNEFKKIHKAALRNFWFGLLMMRDFERDTGEFFAEGFARFYHSEKSRAALKKTLPECYEFLDKMENYFLTVRPHDS